MDQEHADYSDSAPPPRPPSLAGTITLIIVLTVLSSFMICAGLYCLLWLDLGK